MLLFSAPAEEKRVTIYSLVANYSLPVVERDGQDYVGLLEALDPLGEVRATSESLHWRLRYNNVDCEFTSGSSRVRLGRADFDLRGNFRLENGHGMVTVNALAPLLSRILGGPVTMHETSRRVFIGNASVHFTAQINKQNPPTLVMNFTSPVNPMIATEPGKLRMVFTREALMAPGSSLLTFGDRTIPSASYQEINGAAEITINSAIPLFASYSNNNRTITIAPAPQPVAQYFPPANPQPAASTSAPVAPASIPRAGPQFLIVVDASHGGDEHGEAMTGQLTEKDVTLAFARNLRQELQNRGVTVVLLRDSDAALSQDQRASQINLKHPVLYISLHSSSHGNGVRLYTALLPADSEDKGPFLDWNNAQTAFLPLSKAAASTLALELQKRQISVRILAAPLRPLNNVTVPALAVEVAPSSGDVADLTSSAYQQKIASGIAEGVVLARAKLEAGR